MDEDELLPNSAVVETATHFVAELFAVLDAPPPRANVGTFSGEVNLTWRTGGAMVRLAFFPDRPTLVAFGTLSEPAGSYRSELRKMWGRSVQGDVGLYSV